MTRHEYDTCDDCGKRMPHAVYTLDRVGDVITLSDPLPEISHACSTACLVRLATSLHRHHTGGLI